jgi:hypothetical protein
MFSKILHFIKDDSGSLATGGILILLPLIGLSLGTSQVTKYINNLTRIHQSQTSAAIAISKEGQNAELSDKEFLLNNWMDINNIPLGLKKQELEYYIEEIDNMNNNVIINYDPIPFFNNLMDGIFEKNYNNTQSVTAERAYFPMEIVIVLDASSSMTQVSDVIMEMAETVTDKLFIKEDYIDDLWISIISYGGFVNIGRDYADKLIIPESRKLFKGDNIDLYNAQVKTLNHYNENLVTDLLSTNGPGYSIDMTCPIRRQLPLDSSNDIINKYVDNIEIPPTRPEDGFQLLISDGRNNLIEHNKDRPISSNTPYSIIQSLSWIRPEYNPVKIDILDLALVPIDWYYGKEEERFIYAKYKDWGNNDKSITWFTGYTYDNGPFSGTKAISTGPQVTICIDCPPMPMLVGSHRKSDIIERIKMFKGSWTTAGDEGLAWALRVLSPKWRSIWEIEENFPADYHGKVKKRAIVMVGSMTSGYNNQSSPDAFTPLCKKYQDNGIQLFLLKTSSEYINSKSLVIYDNCVSNYGAIMFIEAQKTDLPIMMAKLVEREYITRLK